MPAVGPPKIGTITDLALNLILLLDEADGGGLEDPHGLRDGRRVLEDPQVPRSDRPRQGSRSALTIFRYITRGMMGFKFRALLYDVS